MNSKTLRRRMGLMLIDGICVLDVAEALRSVDMEALQPDPRIAGVGFIGVREAGRVTGFLALPQEAGAQAAPIPPAQVLPETAGLSEAIRVLDEFPCCFVEVLGEVAGVVTREDMEKPPARMWLFGILAIIEPYCSRALEDLFPDQSWIEHVPPARLRKAEALQSERERRGVATPLVDCLQLSDKLEALLRDPEVRGDFGVASRREGIRLAKALESLRNNLAHHQPIAESNWAVVVRAACRLERILQRQ